MGGLSTSGGGGRGRGRYSSLARPPRNKGSIDAPPKMLLRLTPGGDPTENLAKKNLKRGCRKVILCVAKKLTIFNAQKKFPRIWRQSSLKTD